MDDKEDSRHQRTQSDSDCDDDDDDESDEDFCPENVVESDVSEEENNDDDDESDDDNSNNDDDDDDDRKKSKKLKTTSKLKTKKQNKIKQKQNGKRKRSTAKNSLHVNNTESSEKEEHHEHHFQEHDENDKKKSDALWADFLNDVNEKSSKSLPSSCNASSKNDTSKDLPVVTKDNQKDFNEKSEKIKITEIYDFAGEEVKIEKEISVNEMKKLNTKSSITNDKDVNSASSNSSDNSDNSKQDQQQTRPSLSSVKNPQKPIIMNPLKRPLSSSGSSGVGSGALGSILGQFGKKTKISVLEKSKLDWNNFKQKEGLTEELQTFNKGKDGYLERQDFLQRTDLRQFEIESSLRKTNRSKR